MILELQKLIYITWVRSHLEYASVLWLPYTKINITSLEQIQRRTTRFILNKEYSEHEHLSNTFSVFCKKLFAYVYDKFSANFLSWLSFFSMSLK